MSYEPEDDPGMALDLAAAEVRADSGELQALVGALAVRLEQALPRLVAVKRHKIGGFRSKETEIQSISLNLGEARFDLVRTPGGFDCTRHNVVRGITLKREQRELDQWIDEVVAAVTHVAEVGEQARTSLEALIR
jgi:hypothetical protein